LTTVVIENVTQTQLRQLAKAFAQQLLANAPMPQVVALQGELGAGKTTFTQALFDALGVSHGVNSPTFVLFQQYKLDQGLVLNHADLYRLSELMQDSDQVQSLEARLLALQEAMNQPMSITCVEWPSLLPDCSCYWQWQLELCHVSESPDLRSLRLLRAPKGASTQWFSV
jgi:tRNA threonylcarbamoyl adenosine modification protein YjeE